MNELKIGQRVSFKASGKVARLEGVSGKVVSGVITGFHADLDLVSVLADYHTVPGVRNFNMGSAVAVSKIIR